MTYEWMLRQAFAIPIDVGVIDRAIRSADKRRREMPRDTIEKQQTTQNVQIKAPRIETAVVRIIGTAPYVQNKFSAKARVQIMETQARGQQSRSRKQREAKDFDAVYEQAMHVSREGWAGIPAPAIRNGLISACRLVGFKMTLAKLSAFIEPDGFDRDDGTPLIRILKGDPVRHEAPVRNQTGVIDIRVRPMWPEWEADVRIRYDVDQFSLGDIINLMHRIGAQVGIGEGRPDSRQSAGMGWGLFKLQESK